MKLTLKAATIKHINENSLIIEFENSLDSATHHKVTQLDYALQGADIAEHIEILPSFRSLMIEYDLSKISADEIIDALENISLSTQAVKLQKWRVPICFEGDCAGDLTQMSNALSMPKQALIDRFLASKLEVYMYGFTQGFAYLGGLDMALNIPRRKSPDGKMSLGSVIVAGGLAGISSVSSMTGWYVLGRTPMTLFDAKADEVVPFSVGDCITFYAVDLTEYERLKKLNIVNQRAGLALLQSNLI